jgi:hypothetical protein
MAQHYSDREEDTYALPDMETWCSDYGYCPECDSMIIVATRERSYKPRRERRRDQ